MDDSPSKDESPRFLKVLEALKQASHELQSNPTSPELDESHSSAVKALLDLETIDDPHLLALSQHLADLKNLVETLQKARGHTFRSFLTRRVSAHSISRVAGSIEFEIQAWIDRENVETLANALRNQIENRGFVEDDELVMLLTQLASRVSQGFNLELQDLVLKSKLFSSFESVLFDSTQSMKVRETAAYCVAALIRFNKDVFVGQVSMNSTIHALLQMSTACSTKVLCALIRLIKSAFVDEIVSNGKIPKIINFLEVKETETRIVALDCVLEIGYFGRKEAIEAMLEEGLIQKLVEMQRSELGGDLIEIAVNKGNKNDGDYDEEGHDNNNINKNGRREKTSEFLERRPFASCVARFAVQLEVGEGLRQREKRAFKQEILKRVREASASDAEVGTIVAEVLWGSSP